jgi:hypothetical protein
VARKAGRGLAQSQSVSLREGKSIAEMPASRLVWSKGVSARHYHVQHPALIRASDYFRPSPHTKVSLMKNEEVFVTRPLNTQRTPNALRLKVVTQFGPFVVMSDRVSSYMCLLASSPAISKTEPKL